MDLEAPITEVTVYADRALVTRRGKLRLEAGEHELRVNNLPQFLRESLRASGHGPQGTRILNVDITTAFYSRPPEAELLTLQTSLEQLQQQRHLLQARQDALNDRRQWLRALGEQSKDFAKGLAQGQMKPSDCADFFGFMAEQALQDAEAAQQLALQMQHLQQDIEAHQRELAHQQGINLPDRLAAVITLVTPAAGEIELALSYLILGAAWHPQYDVRVQMNDETSDGEVELSYIGLVQQSTGERWENVELSLSTARPSLAAVLPELHPLYLNAYTPPPPPPPLPAAMYAPQPTMTRMSKTAPYGQTLSNTPGHALTDDYEKMITSEEAVPMAAPVSSATATVEHTGTALVFRAGRSVDIPSDNSPHKTTIAHDSLPCEFDYVSAPVVEEDVHVRATITNSTERVLLNGEAHIFLGGEYVGTTQVKQTAPSEQFKIFLGIGDTVKVKRELLERAVDKGSLLQGDLRRITYAYALTVHNYGPFPRKVVLRDHLPVPQHERIKVRVQSIQPLPSERSKLELLTWEFPLGADQEQRIEYRFVVEHPQSLKVTGLP